MKNLKQLLLMLLVSVCGCAPITLYGNSVQRVSIDPVFTQEVESDDQKEKMGLSTVQWMMVTAGTMIVVVGGVVYFFDSCCSGGVGVQNYKVYEEVTKKTTVSDATVSFGEKTTFGVAKEVAVGVGTVLKDFVIMVENVYEGNKSTEGTVFVSKILKRSRPFCIAVNRLSKKYAERVQSCFDKTYEWLS